MGALIAVIGNTAVGKTTLVKRLKQAAPFATGLEQHAERPFQRLLVEDLRAGRGRRYAFANQVDYLLLRAEQELAMRSQPGIGLMDGGLDEDFYVFTRGFHALGILDAAEFALCERFYRFVRALQPEPDLYILLQAPLEQLAARMKQRARSIEIATVDSLPVLQQQVEVWVQSIAPQRLIVLDASTPALLTPQSIAHLLTTIELRLSVRTT
ncbi:MAG: deoxynucleoside kinase [Caldilinea sp.]|nr:deoxynucleoside kinase [Caldilinea sp.]MDW8441801.1 deoxynucleoside kinase [Caldilineaceae bacterium]